jgi:methionyl-tRNA formyltransferase
MMATGAALMTETLNRIDKGTIELKEQSSFQMSIIKEAPKLSTAFCQIHFHRNAQDVHNHIRGLSPFPGAHCTIRFGNDSSGMKLFRTELPHLDRPLAQPGSLFISDDGHIYVCCSDNWLEILELQQAGKKRMPAKEFLKGFRNIENAHLE